jgi:hypothetical protein
MKTLLLTLFVSLNMLAQPTLTAAKLIGNWTSNGEALDLTITQNPNGKLDVCAVSSTSLKEVLVKHVHLLRDYLFIDTIFEPNDWHTESRFELIDENTMLATISGDGEGEVMYAKVIQPLFSN